MIMKNVPTILLSQQLTHIKRLKTKMPKEMTDPQNMN